MDGPATATVEGATVRVPAGTAEGTVRRGVHGMSDPRWHLAQLNVGRLLAPVESPAIEGFVRAARAHQRARRRAPGLRLAAPDRGRQRHRHPPDRGRPVPHQHERLGVDRGAAGVHLHDGPCPGPAAPPVVVRAARLGAPRAVVGARRATSRRSTRRWIGSNACAGTGRRRPRSRSARRSSPRRSGRATAARRRRVLLAGARRVLDLRDLTTGRYRPGCQSGSSTPRAWFS